MFNIFTTLAFFLHPNSISISNLNMKIWKIFKNWNWYENKNGKTKSIKGKWSKNFISSFIQILLDFKNNIITEIILLQTFQW